MCGIAGFVASKTSKVELSSQFTEVLAHRGPDSFGTLQDDRVSLFHWRLSIIDLTDAGAQPMVSSDGSSVLCYNGEIYNFQELREEIDEVWRKDRPAEESFPWRGRSDSEVLLEGLNLFGISFLEKLNGMFAFAVYNRRARTLTLARDRGGVKPLYFWQAGDQLAFASEAKAFFHFGNFLPEVADSGLRGYFTYGHVWGSGRMLKGVEKLGPGMSLTVSLDSKALEPSLIRFSPLPGWKKSSLSYDSAVLETRRLVTTAVERQLVSDVPVGLFLSGGVDSSIIAAIMARALGPRQTRGFTLRHPGHGSEYDEGEPAAAVARHLGIEHECFDLAMDKVAPALDRIVWHYDEPFADAAAVNMYFLSSHMRRKITVALAGEGADELFGGYRRYQVELLLRKFDGLASLLGRCTRGLALDHARHLPRRLQIFARSTASTSPSNRYSAYFENGVTLEQLLRRKPEPDFDPRSDLAKLYPQKLNAPLVATLCIADQVFWLPDTYLEKSDKGSMACSLEIRVPYLDNDVVAFANTLPDEFRIRGLTRKRLLRDAFRDHLPEEVWNRPKRGFSIPIGQWIRGEMKDFVADSILGPDALHGEHLDLELVRKLFEEHCRGERDQSLILWQVLIFERWLRLVRRGFRHEPAENTFNPDRSSRFLGVRN